MQPIGLEDEIHICDNCDAEFSVAILNEDSADVSYCPYCGYEMNSDEEEDGEENDSWN